jgi:glycosyltransferase involved in cell wall biosynthesis
MKISVVIPALNEEEGIGAVIDQIPVGRLKSAGYGTEILVIDNGSSDKTAEIARAHGARVIVQPIRGYGNAYKTGFANATGDIIATGDADMTYPFDSLPEILERMERDNLEFITTDRLSLLNPEAMSQWHLFGNVFLTKLARLLYGWPYKDSQSGMWVFKRSIWPKLDVHSKGMPFSQELKLEAYMKGFRNAELPIEYRVRAGHVKLSGLGDPIRTTSHLFMKRLRSPGRARRKKALRQLAEVVD